MIVNKIPKVIHYCWFGRGNKNGLIEYCMKSWEDILSEYEIKEWNENNFDINCNKYVKQAYENGKWAFVSDYVRLYALYTEGGVYLDTDVEITSKLDDFLKYSSFIGFHSDTQVPSALMGSEKGNSFIKKLLDYYKDKPFIKNDGSLDYKTNIEIITELCVNYYNLRLDNSHQIVGKDTHFLPKEYFTLNNRSDKNYAIHHFNASWVPREVLMKQVKTYKSYYLLTLKWLERLLDSKELLVNVLNNNRLIAIYGIGHMGRVLLKQCSQEAIKISYIIDNGASNKMYDGISIIKNKDLKNHRLDCIIVTPIYDFKQIEKELRMYTDANIISLEQIIYE